MKKINYSLESFSAGHFFEDLQNKEDFYVKKFFGGLSVYVHGKFVAFLSEKPGVRDYRGKKYKMDLWNGCLVPTSYENQKKLLGHFKDAQIHPVIEKWIYLRAESSSFESNMLKLILMVQKNDDSVGVIPALKEKAPLKKRSKNGKQKIAQMMNLGPAAEKDFLMVGIKYADQIKKLGAKKAFVKMLEGRKKLKRDTKCCNALYLYAIYGAIKNIHWTQIPDEKKQEFKKMTEKLRKTGRFA